MLESLLGSKTRARVLTRLFLDGRPYRLLELQRAVGTSVSSVQKVVAALEQAGLVRSERVADARILTAVASHPLAPSLRALLEADRANGAVPVNPRVAPLLAEITRACERSGAVSAALVGSSTQTSKGVVPNDLDVLVRFDSGPAGYAERYFDLLEELERIVGMPVQLIDEDGVTNVLLREEFEATKVVLYEAA